MGQTLSPVFRIQVNSNALPSWVPQLGQIANVSLNKMNDVNLCPGNLCGIITGFGWDVTDPTRQAFGTATSQSLGVTGFGGLHTNGGMIYAPLVGTLGSLYSTGGGHNDRHIATVVRYDIATRLHSIAHEPPYQQYYTKTSVSLPSAEFYKYYNADSTNGEMWADSTLTSTLQNEPGAAHIYGYQVYLPPGVAGVGAKGALVTTVRPDLSPVGSEQGKRSHIFDFVTNTWQRFSVNTVPFVSTQTVLHTGSCYDPVRNCIWLADSHGGLAKLDLATKLWTRVIPDQSLSFAGFFGSLLYIPGLDTVAWINKTATGSSSIKLINPDAPASVFSPPIGGIVMPPTSSDVAGQGTHGGGDWCPTLGARGAFVNHAGDGTNFCYTLTPPAGNIYTGTWTWSENQLTPVTAADHPPFQFVSNQSFHCTRFRWVDPIKCFLWWATSGSNINAWRVLGT
jgi:hypothetical protein